nr:unnamed protein product [Digitaria exilis]
MVYSGDHCGTHITWVQWAHVGAHLRDPDHTGPCPHLSHPHVPTPLPCLPPDFYRMWLRIHPAMPDAPLLQLHRGLVSRPPCLAWERYRQSPAIVTHKLDDQCDSPPSLPTGPGPVACASTVHYRPWKLIDLGMAIPPVDAGTRGFYTQWVRVRVQHRTHGCTRIRTRDSRAPTQPKTHYKPRGLHAALLVSSRPRLPAATLLTEGPRVRDPRGREVPRRPGDFLLRLSPSSAPQATAPGCSLKAPAQGCTVVAAAAQGHTVHQHPAAAAMLQRPTTEHERVMRTSTAYGAAQEHGNTGDTMLQLLLSHPRAPETRPKPGGCGRRNPPAGFLWVGFLLLHGFGLGRVFLHPHPHPRISREVKEVQAALLQLSAMVLFSERKNGSHSARPVRDHYIMEIGRRVEEIQARLLQNSALVLLS